MEVIETCNGGLHVCYLCLTKNKKVFISSNDTYNYMCSRSEKKLNYHQTLTGLTNNMDIYVLHNTQYLSPYLWDPIFVRCIYILIQFEVMQ